MRAPDRVPLPVTLLFNKRNMIAYQQIGPHLFREDAYREYCWSVDAYGQYQPASFIYLCFESFRELLSQRGILLMRVPEHAQQETIPWRYQKNGISSGPFLGLVTRIDSDTDVAVIKKYLHEGHNVLALLPNEINALYGNMRGETEHAKYRGFLNALGLDRFASRLSAKLCNRDTVWWEEIPSTTGRLFVTEDSFISDAYFMKGYGQTDQNTASIMRLADAFATRRFPHIHLSWENPVSSWVCHEPYTLHLKAKNLGAETEGLTIEIEIPTDAVAMSTLTFATPNLPPLGSVSLAVQLEFRNAGNFKPIMNVNLLGRENGTVNMSLDCHTLEVAPSVRGLALQNAPQDTKDFSRFLAIAKSAGSIIDLANIQQLAHVDVEAALNKMRKAGERLAVHILRKHNPKIVVGTFSDCVREIQSQRLLSSRAIGYFHTLRVLGNLASHPHDSHLTDTDVRVGAYALAAVIEEVVDRKYV